MGEPLQMKSIVDNYWKKMAVLREILTTGCNEDIYWNKNTLHLGEIVYYLKDDMNKYQAWINEGSASGQLTPEQARSHQKFVNSQMDWIDNKLLKETISIRESPNGKIRDCNVLEEYTKYQTSRRN
jgi:hypothetical protein